MLRPLIVSLACVGLVIVTSAGAADARPLPRFRYAATAVDTPVSDGARYLAFAVSDTRTRVVDTKLGHRVDLDTPVGDVPASLADPHCRLQAMAAGKILWTCPALSHRKPNQLVEEVQTRRFLPTPGMSDLSPMGTNFSRVGRYWLGGWLGVPQTTGAGLFYNSLSGQARWAAWAGHYGDHHVEDLNWPSLMHPLCGPLRRPRYRTVISESGGFENVVRTYGLFDYQPPYALAAPLTYYQDADLSLYRCGFSRPIRLDRCTGDAPCTQIVFGARRVTWQTYRRIRAYNTVTKRAYAWTTDDIGLVSPGQYFVLTHTAQRIFIAYAPRLKPNGSAVSWTIRAAAWPAS